MSENYQLVYYMSSTLRLAFGYAVRMAGIVIIAIIVEFCKELDDQPDSPKTLSCRKVLRSSQWFDIPDLIYAGSSPQNPKRLTVRNVGPWKRTTHGEYRSKIICGAWHKLHARARPILPGLTRGVARV